MPILKSAKKALKVAKRRKSENDKMKKRLREAQKTYRSNPSNDSLKAAFSTIDTAAKKHFIHKNKASRLKSSLSKLLTK